MAAFDTLDMAELMFGDAGCIQDYGTGWQVIFYLALGMSAIMTTFYWGLEGLDKDDEPGTPDYIATVLGLIFNDVLFLIVRCKVMDVQHDTYLSLLFPIKESFSIFVRLGFIIYFSRN